jgi:hypothetical protein
VKSELLGIALADNVKARQLQPDGSYVIPSVKPGTPERRSQSEFIELARGDSRILRRDRKPKPKHPTFRPARNPAAG